MEIDTAELRPTLAAYVDEHGDVFDSNSPDELWLRRASNAYRAHIDDLPLTDLDADHLDRLVLPLPERVLDGDRRIVDRHQTTNANWWVGVRRICEDDPAEAAAVLSTLFTESIPIEKRLRAFRDYFEPAFETVGAVHQRVPSSMSSAQIHGISTQLLELVYPDSYLAYKYKESRAFFEAYSDYEVKNAGSRDVERQYATLLDGWEAVRDELRNYYPDADMLDVHAIVWNHEALRERAPEDPRRRPRAGGSPPRNADRIERALEASGQVILYGPPGTGKTYAATEFARWWTARRGADGPVRHVTFHPSFSYEDFVEGLAPTEGRDGSVTYELEDGVFKRAVDDARADYEATPTGREPPRHVLVIDELNRGEVGSIFGELLTGIERDKRLGRPQETPVTLSHSGDRLVVPPNLYLIGTMNTADRSIALIDAAIRRRFHFVQCPPAFDLVREAYDDASDDVAELVELSADALERINGRLRDDLTRGKQIGHAYLFGIDTASELVDVWRFQLLPLLEEYYYDQFDRLRATVFAEGGDELFDWERRQIRPFDEAALRDALSEFR